MNLACAFLYTGLMLTVMLPGAACADSSDRVTSADAAADLLEKRLTKDGPYAGVHRMECLSFEAEAYESAEGEVAYGVEIREIHQGPCASPDVDPNTAPRVDAFTVQRDGTILWLDPTGEEGDLPYERFLAEQKPERTEP